MIVISAAFMVMFSVTAMTILSMMAVAAIPMMAMAVPSMFSLSMSVMAALHIRIIRQFTSQKRLHRLVCIPGHSAVKLNSTFRQSISGSASDAAADQRVHLKVRQKSGQGSMAASVGVCDFLRDDFAILNLIDFKLFRVSEMLIYISVFKCYCYPHCVFSFPNHSLAF